MPQPRNRTLLLSFAFHIVSILVAVLVLEGHSDSTAALESRDTDTLEQVMAVVTCSVSESMMTTAGL